MYTIEVTNVNQAMHHALLFLDEHGIEEPSRNGPVLVAPGPVCTIYHRPWERVLFSPLRDANPFFHLMEALWMLAGRADLAFPQYFNSSFGNYSDDGKTVWGAYGYRWRQWFGYDQLRKIVTELKRNPNSRRAVLSMWDGGMREGRESDLEMAMAGGKDVPCNTHAYFDCRGGRLNMTVCCRSNDIWWGAYGANAVHFSILQEYIAAEVGVPMGVYRQFSNNFHLYTQVVPRNRLREFARDALNNNYYLSGEGELFRLQTVKATQIFPGTTLNDIALFVGSEGVITSDSAFLTGIAAPMYQAYRERKEKMGTGLGATLNMSIANDWQAACQGWINRREQRKGKVTNA